MGIMSSDNVYGDCPNCKAKIDERTDWDCVVCPNCKKLFTYHCKYVFEEYKTPTPRFRD